MDIKKKSWVEEKRKNWPEDSKNQALTRNYPGCKSAFEAVQKILSDKTLEQNPIPLEATKRITKPSNEDYLVMKQCITDIELALKGVDFTLVPDETRQRIAKMPITTQAEAIDWRNAWLEAIRNI